MKDYSALLKWYARQDMFLTTAGRDGAAGGGALLAAGLGAIDAGAGVVLDTTVDVVLNEGGLAGDDLETTVGALMDE